MLRGAWREHVRAELQRRESSSRGLQELLERHERLRDRLETQEAQLQEELLRGGCPSGRRPALAALQVHLRMETAELRREREELRQRVVLLADILREAEAESREQRARMRCLARDLATVTHQREEAERQAWIFSKEAEELCKDLERTRRLLQEAQGERLALEARWVREKALEAGRVNCANEKEEKYWRKLILLRERLAKAKAAAGPPGTESGPGGSSHRGSSDEAKQVPGREQLRSNPAGMSSPGATGVASEEAKLCPGYLPACQESDGR